MITIMVVVISVNSCLFRHIINKVELNVNAND